MRIYNLFFIIYLCSGILLFTQSYPLHRNMEEVKDLIEDARDFNDDDYYPETKVKSSKKKSKSRSRGKKSEKYREGKILPEEPPKFYDDDDNELGKEKYT